MAITTIPPSVITKETSPFSVIKIHELCVGDVTYMGGIVFNIENSSNGLNVMMYDPFKNYFVEVVVSSATKMLCIRKREL